MIYAATFWLTIVAGPYPDDAACEQAKVLTIPGPVVRYRCHKIEGSAAPDWSPIPVPKRKVDGNE